VKNFCWILVGVLLISSGVMTYKFILSGSVKPGNDERIAIQLTSDEREMILTEMRAFLESVQMITNGITTKDFDAVAKAAETVGHVARQQVPDTLAGKLPLEFKKMGFDTHAQFSQLSLDAKQLGDGEHALEQLATVLQNCVACHAAYKLEAVDR